MPNRNLQQCQPKKGKLQRKQLLERNLLTKTSIGSILQLEEKKNSNGDIMPKRKGRLRKDEFVETNIMSGKRKIKRTKKLKLFG